MPYFLNRSIKFGDIGYTGISNAIINSKNSILSSLSLNLMYNFWLSFFSNLKLTETLNWNKNLSISYWVVYLHYRIFKICIWIWGKNSKQNLNLI
jgi:hypothetical protein